jgi:hypothetical protein
MRIHFLAHLVYTHILQNIETLVGHKKFKKKWDNNECRMNKKNSRVSFRVRVP